MEKESFVIKLAFLIIIAVAVIGGAVWWSQKQKPPAKEWQTYQNKTYSYSIDYSVPMPPKEKNGLKQIIFGEEPTKELPEPNFLGVDVHDKKGKFKTTQELIDSIKQSAQKLNQKITFSESDKEIADITATKLTYKGEASTKPAVSIIFEKNSLIFNIYYLEGDSSFNQKIEQMLSNFKTL